MKRGHVNILGVARGLDVFNKYSSGGESIQPEFSVDFPTGSLRGNYTQAVVGD